MSQGELPVSRFLDRDLKGRGFLTARGLRWSVGVLLGYFALRLVFFAVSISGFVPPDEVTHLGLCGVFSKVFFLPANSPETYQFGLVTNIPWLYYWLMGKLLWLNGFGLPDLLFLRLLNIPLAFATVYFAWRTLRLLTDDGLTQLLLVVAMTNTLMFTFLSASVSYDNLTNLLAVMAIYFQLAFFKRRSAGPLAASWLCQLAGCLTKSTFLPLVLILNILLVIREFRSLRSFPGASVCFLKAAGWRGGVWAVVFLAGLALNLQLYGGNYLRYGKLAPEMWDVLPLESVMQYRIAARDAIFIMFKEGRVSYEQAMELTSHINHEGDRKGAVYLIENHLHRKYGNHELLSPLEYIGPWARRMLASVFGIMGHLSMINGGITLLPIIVLIMLATLAILIRWRPGQAEGLPVCLGMIAGLYAVFLMYAINYQVYLYFESFDITLYGRYIFPVITPLYVLSSCYLLRLFNSERLRLMTAFAATLIFIASDFPYFLYRATPEWYGLLMY